MTHITRVSQMSQQRGLALLLILLTVGLLWVGLCVGSTGYQSPQEVMADAATLQIVMDIRLPRSLGALAAGALLGLAGALSQGLFRNPLADPYLLGSAAGASLGVVLFMAIAGHGHVAIGAVADVGAVDAFTQWGMQLGVTGVAFLGASAAVLLTLALARGVGHTLRLLLAGVVVGVVLGAVTALVLQFQPHLLQATQAFMLGSTAFVNWSAVGLMLGVLAICLVLAWLMSPLLDALGLGERTAQSLGLPIAPLRIGLVLTLALATGTAVAHTGLIAFVGLAAPHVVRSLLSRSRGVNHAYKVVLASAMGGVLLLSADIGARALIAPQELPVGVLTAVLGGGYLLWLMQKQTPSLRKG